MTPPPDESPQAKHDTKALEVRLSEASGSMALGITHSLRKPAQSFAAIGARTQRAFQGLEAVPVTSSIAVVSSAVCDILILHSLWCWFLTTRRNTPQQLCRREQPDQQEQHEQQTSPVMQKQQQHQHYNALWRQLDGKTKKRGVFVCSLAAIAIFVTCRAMSGQRRAARAAAIRRKTAGQHSEEASNRVVPLKHLTLEQRQMSEPSEWWFDGSASGKGDPQVQSQAVDKASSGVLMTPASGSCRDAVQSEQQQQQQQQLQLPPPLEQQKHTPLSESSSRGSLHVDSSSQGTPRLQSPPQETPYTRAPSIRNLLSSEDLANNTPNRTTQLGRSGPFFKRKPSITNLLPTA